MTLTIDVIFDGEVLRPNRPLDLQPNHHYSVTITDDAATEAAHAAESDPDPTVGEAWRLYDEKFKSRLEPEFIGQVVAIDIDSEDFEVAKRSAMAWRPLKARRPNARIVVIDIGPVRPNNPLEGREHGEVVIQQL